MEILGSDVFVSLIEFIPEVMSICRGMSVAFKRRISRGLEFQQRQGCVVPGVMVVCPGCAWHKGVIYWVKECTCMGDQKAEKLGQCSAQVSCIC